MTTTQCTSSSDDESVLEEEMENLDNEGGGATMEEDIEDLSDIAEEDLESVEGNMGGEEVALDDEAEFDEIDLEEEGADFADNSEGGDEDFSDDEFAEFDESEFSEFDNVEGGSEEELAKEMEGQDYPLAQGAQPQFPEEVVSANKQQLDPFMGDPGNPPPGGGSTPPPLSPIPGPGQPLITSETTAITVPDEAIEPQMPQDDLGMADPIVPPDVDEPEEKPSWIPVVKIKTDAFYRNKRLLNAVYIARPDDSLESISDKIFKDDRTAELKSDNEHLAKGIDPGDKVYYNSPNRPEDTSELKVYYADIGLAPQYYKTQKDDNMRRLGSKLLGFSDGWKEIWAINQNVDSKTILPKGIELKYWTGNESNPVVQAGVEEETKMPEAQPISGGVDPTFEDPPLEEMVEVELPPEPPIPDTQVAMPEPVANPEVPDIEPFPEEGVEATPGPPPVAITSQKQDDSLLTVGALALLLMAGAGLVAIQIKKRKDNTGISPQSLEYTQV